MMLNFSHKRLRKSLAKSMEKVHAANTGPEGLHVNEVWCSKEDGLLVIAAYSPPDGKAAGTVALSEETLEFLGRGNLRDEEKVAAIIPFEDFHFEGEATSVMERNPVAGDVIVAKDENGKEFTLKITP